MRIIVAGCGWLGTEVARRLLQRGDEVVAIRRGPARAEALRALGVEPLALDLAAPGAAARLPAGDAIVACQSASGEDAASYRAAYLDANRALLAAAARTGATLVYTGSTGVFGQQDGSEADEGTPPAPAGANAEILTEAEALVRGAGGRLLRLSGLYGPGRIGIVERVRSGRLALGPGDGAWMNFCHLEDAAALVLGALDRGTPGAVYHGSDAEPTRRRDVVAWIARRTGVDPRAGPASAGPDRRIRADRTRAELGLALAFPSFREGIEPLLPPRSPAGHRGG